MSDYSNRVKRGLHGLEAVSTGVCPGCQECMAAWEYIPCETDTGWICEADPEAGVSPTEEAARSLCEASFEIAVSSGEVFAEESFSSSRCAICGSTLGGSRWPWHAIDMDTGELYHFDGACTDCVVYLANGEEPPEDQ